MITRPKIVGPWDFWDNNGRLVYHVGDIRIYMANKERYLFVGQTMYDSTSLRKWYIDNILKYCKGKVLEIGLGLGCASEVILTSPLVSSLVSIESNPDIISTCLIDDSRHKIVNREINEWVRNVPGFSFFDFIFVNHYSFSEGVIPELKDLRQPLCNLLNPGGSLVYWIDPEGMDEDKDAVKSLWLIKKTARAKGWI